MPTPTATAQSFTNNGQGTVQSGHSAGPLLAGDLDFFMNASGLTSFPTTGNFTIQIDSELLLVTAGQGTTHWTVTRGVENTTPAQHAANTPVYQQLTVGGFATTADGYFPSFRVAGSPGHTGNNSRYVGSVAGAAPTSGQFYAGDYAVDTLNGFIWVCTADGTPGTWQAGGLNSPGLVGATGATRWVGGTTGGPPTSGTFLVGDFIIDNTGGYVWVCTAGGTPGTWSNAANTPYYRTTLGDPGSDLTFSGGAVAEIYPTMRITFTTPASGKIRVAGAVLASTSVTSGAIDLTYWFQTTPGTWFEIGGISGTNVGSGALLITGETVVTVPPNQIHTYTFGIGQSAGTTTIPAHGRVGVQTGTYGIIQNLP